MATKTLMAQQILYRIYGGYPDVNSPIQEPDVIKAIEQCINYRYKTQYYNEILPSGETIPNNSALMPFTNVAVAALNGKAYSLLPTMPVKLPRNMGVFNIEPANSLDISPKIDAFIPLQAGQRQLLNSDVLLNDLLFQVGYEVKGNKVYYSKDITLLGVTAVDMDLITMDISQFSETENLPITPDIEQDILNEVYAIFVPVTPEDGSVNNYSNLRQQPLKQ